MSSRGLHSRENSVIVILGVGISLWEPYDLLAVNALTVDNGAYLSVASARVKSDTAAVKMSAYGSCVFFIYGRVLYISVFNCDRGFINLGHNAPVESASAVWRISLCESVGDKFRTRDYNLVSASYPDKALYDSFNEFVVFIVVSRSIGVNNGLEYAYVSLVSFDSDNQSVTTRSLCCLGELTVYQNHRLESLV